MYWQYSSLENTSSYKGIKKVARFVQSFFMVSLFIRGITIGFGREHVEMTVQGNAAMVDLFSLEQYMIGFTILIFSMTLKIAMDIARIFETTVEELFYFTEEE